MKKSKIPYNPNDAPAPASTEESPYEFKSHIENKNVWEVAYRGRDWIAWYDFRERCFVLECKNADGFKIQIERPENFVTADYIGWFQIALRQIHNLLNNGKCSY